MIVASMLAMIVAGCGSGVSSDRLSAANEPRAANPAAGSSTAANAPDSGTAAAAVEAPSESPGAPPVTSSDAVSDAAQTVRTPVAANGPRSESEPGKSSGGAATAPAGQAKTTPGSGGSAAGAAPAPVSPGGPGSDGPKASGPKPSIKLGSIGTQSGPVGQAIIGSLIGAKAWAADVNARGGLNGHPVEVVFGDDAGDPARALALAKRMVEQDKVAGFFAIYAPLTAQSFASYLEEKGLPAIETCSCSTTFTDTSPMFFPVGHGTTVGLAWSHVAALSAVDKHKVAVIYCRESVSCADSARIIAEKSGEWGLKVVQQSQASVAQPDFTAEVLAARNAGADALVIVMENASAIRIVRAARRQNYTPAFTSQFNPYDEAFVENGGADVEGFLYVAKTAPWSTSTKMADFRSVVPKIVPGADLNDHVATAWVAGKLLEKAAAGFPDGPVSAKDILTGLYSLHGESLGGLLPPITYRQGKGHADTNQCAVPMTIKGGKFVPLNGDNFVCAPGWKPVAS